MKTFQGSALMLLIMVNCFMSELILMVNLRAAKTEIVLAKMNYRVGREICSKGDLLLAAENTSRENHQMKKIVSLMDTNISDGYSFVTRIAGGAIVFQKLSMIGLFLINIGLGGLALKELKKCRNVVVS